MMLWSRDLSPIRAATLAALTAPIRESASESGAMFVYAVEASNGLLKIGITDNLRGRLRQIAAHSPLPVVLRAYIPCANRQEAKSIETNFHNQFKLQCDHGEWYSINCNYVITKFELIGGISCEMIYTSGYTGKPNFHPIQSAIQLFSENSELQSLGPRELERRYPHISRSTWSRARKGV